METTPIHVRGDYFLDVGPQTGPEGLVQFICTTLKPSLHLSTVTRDKMILLFVIVQGIKFDEWHVIECGIIESTRGQCIGALIHPSLIT